jgi:hypothetical protein
VRIGQLARTELASKLRYERDRLQWQLRTRPGSVDLAEIIRHYATIDRLAEVECLLAQLDERHLEADDAPAEVLDLERVYDEIEQGEHLAALSRA